MKPTHDVQGAAVRALAQAVRILLPVVLLLVLPGCLSDGFGADPTNGVEQTPERVLAQAERDLNNGEYAAAVHRLLDVLMRGEAGPLALEAQFLLAKAHLQAGAYPDAQQNLWAYLREAPEGPRREEAEAMLKEVEAETGLYRVTNEALAAQLEAAEAALASNGELPGNWLNLADLQWKQGRYGEAARSYMTLIQRWPEYATHPPVSERMEVGPDGRYFPVTPAVVTQRVQEAQPLVVYGVHSYRRSEKGWEDQSVEDAYYHITGLVKNRGPSPLRGVELEIRLYNTVGQLLDVTYYRLGTLRPGMERAFSIQFTNFDTIYNVGRYEILPIYEAAG